MDAKGIVYLIPFAEWMLKVNMAEQIRVVKNKDANNGHQLARNKDPWEGEQLGKKQGS